MTSALDGVSGQRHALAALCLRVWTNDTHWIGGLVDLRDGLDTKADRTPVVRCVVRYYTD
jgi:hypothetical protein